MSSDTRVALSSVAEIVSTKVAVSSLAGQPYVSTENLLPNLGGLGEGELPDADRVNVFKKSDTLFSNIRPYFRKVHYAPVAGGCSADVLVFRTKNPQEFWPAYLYYCLADPTFIEYTMATCKGAKMPRGDKGAMLQYVVSKPELAIQKKVSSLLRSLDESILTLQHQNTSLEAIAQRLFRSWFVNFDPVHAKAAGKEPEAMSAELAALFPSEFEDSELGPIPKGWTVESLDRSITYLNGLALQKFPPLEGEAVLPVLKIAQLKAGRTDVGSLANRKMRPEYVVKDGDIVFSWSGSLEIRIWTGGEAALNQHLFKVFSRVHPEWFCYQSTLKHLPLFRQIAASKATTMGHIQRHHLTEAKISVAPAAVMLRFSAVFGPMQALIVQNGKLIKELEELRDHLMPRLISGKLSLEEAQQVVEEATAA